MGGIEHSADDAFASAYEELRRLAHSLFAREAGAHTLQTTALLNEAFLRLRSSGDEIVSDPARFRRCAAVAMRRILIEHARGRASLKRGERSLPRSLDSVELCARGDFEQVLAVDDAIEHLANESPDLAEVVRLRFYAGLEITEVANAMTRSERSIKRDWTYAKARLFQLLGDGA